MADTQRLINSPEQARPLKMSIKVSRFVDVEQLNEYKGSPRILDSSVTVSVFPVPYNKKLVISINLFI